MEELKCLMWWSNNEKLLKERSNKFQYFFLLKKKKNRNEEAKIIMDLKLLMLENYELFSEYFSKNLEINPK